MSTVIAIWLPSKKTKRCPLDSDNDILWLMSWKSFVVCGSWSNTTAQEDTALQFVTPNNTVQAGCAMIVVNYPAGIKPNDEDCDKQKYVKVKMDSSCQVGAGVVWQCLIISINSDYQNPSVTDPFWVSPNDLSENWWTLYANYIKISTRLANDATWDPVYSDDRCFENNQLKLKRCTKVLTATWTIDQFDPVALLPDGTVIRADEVSWNNWAEWFFWVSIASGTVLDWWNVRVQWCGAVDNFDFIADPDTPLQEWQCIYVGNFWFWGFTNVPWTNCIYAGKYCDWKLHIADSASCIAWLKVLERLKAVEEALIPTQSKKCDIVTVRRVLTWSDAESWSWTFNFWHNMTVESDCVEFTMWITCANAPQFTTIIAQKVDWKWCDWEQRWCKTVLRDSWDVQSIFPTSWNLWEIEVQDNWPNGTIVVTAWNQTWNNAQFTVVWADMDCDELVLNFFYKVSWK